MADLDNDTARRVKQSVERFAETGAGNVKRLLRISIRPSSASAPACMWRRLKSCGSDWALGGFGIAGVELVAGAA